MSVSLEGVVEARSLAECAMATLQRLEIRASPANFAIWYEYHAGLIPNLQRTIDVILSNHAGFTEERMKDLFSTFFSSAKEAQAVRSTSLLALKTLQDMVAIAHVAGAAAHDASVGAHQFGDALHGFASGDLGASLGNLMELIENLVEESRTMAGRSEYVGLRMRESTDRIEALEHDLESAIRDAAIDGLTGAANRKSFDSAIHRMAGDAMNSGDDLALLMIDIDHFKRVNDTWGHPVGDSVLRHLTKAVQQTVRGEDHVARYGGEEFAVILPRTCGKAAVAVAENIRRTLARDPIALVLTPRLMPITVSIGVACYEPGDPLADWVGRTDAALYHAKREGRDRVEFDKG
jgi:diguanylate cyclase